MSVSEIAPNRGVVLVTDIGFEHGARTAAEFLDAGWSVAVTARTVTELVRDRAGKPPHRVFAIVAEPTERWQADRILERVTTRFGVINRVIDPAGAVTSVWLQRGSLEAVA